MSIGLGMFGLFQRPGVRSRRVLCCVLLMLPFTLLAGRFQHPGIGLNRAQLDQLKANVQNGIEPWKHNFEWLKKNDHRFSKKPRIFTRRGENIESINSPDFDNRCAWDSQTAYCQAVMYELTGEACYREYALDVVRWFYTHITRGHPHWDSQFRWPHAEGWYLRAAELLRYTGPKEGPLAWTQADTDGVNRFIAIGKGFWWGRGTLLNQLQFTLGGPLARSIWNDDWEQYCEMVEILTANKQGPVGERNGSIREMCRLVTTNELTGAKVKPHVQYSEMGRDIGHPFPGAGQLGENLTILWSQNTLVDPVTGEVSAKKDAVDPIEFLNHQYLRGVNQICKYNLGFDIEWTPIAINRKKGDYWKRPANWGGGRGRLSSEVDIVYMHYKWGRGWDLSKSEETRYIGYALDIRGLDYSHAFLWLPQKAAGRCTLERHDPGKDGVNRFAEFIQPRIQGLSVEKDKSTGAQYISLTNKAFVFPMFLPFRRPLTKPGEYTIRYRCDGPSGMAVINPEDYNTEFADPETCEKRIYVEKVKLPPTGREWKEHTFTLSAPPNRNLVKLEFRTKGKHLDLEWLKVPK
ncbi:MAG: hypothetical protein ACI4TC_11065 [Kiritimatiellia bacterium]